MFERLRKKVETHSNIHLRQIGDRFVIVECDNVHVVIDLCEVISYELLKGGVKIHNRDGSSYTVWEK